MKTRYLALALAALSQPAAAQTLAVPVELPVDAPGTSALTAAQLDQLVAPIALYPDPVLTDILAASTSPAQIVEAARFAASNAALQGAALSDAAAGHHWEPSVQALLAFPPVLHMLDGDLESTDQLGRAFMTQQGDVLDAIQRLRLAAERSGSLQNGPDVSVVNDGGAIAINPPSPQAVYLPSYDAGCVYGGDLSGCAEPAEAIGWDGGVFLPFGFAPWAVVDWAHRRIPHFYHGEGGWHGAAHPIGSGASGAPRLGGVQNYTGRTAATTAEPYFYAPPAGSVRAGYGVPHVESRAGRFASPSIMRAGGVRGVAHLSAPVPAVHAGFAPVGFGGHR